MKRKYSDPKFMKQIVFILLLYSMVSFAQDPRRDTLPPSYISALRRGQTGERLIRGEDIHVMTTPLGDGSAIKLIQTLPGVSTGAEGSSAIYVRGGNLGGNLVTIDNVPLYGSGHILGFSTSYSPGIVADTRFMTGGFTSGQGNLTSSHIKVTTKDGAFDALRAGVSLSPFIVGATVSAPVIKDKVSFLGSVRVSPVGAELNAIKGLTAAMDSVSGIKAVVYDAFGKIKWNLSPRQSVSLSAFTSLDSYGFNYGGSSEDRMRWGNTIASLSHEIAVADRWAVESGLSYNKFTNYQGIRKTFGSTDNSLALSGFLEEKTLRSTVLWSGPEGWSFQASLKACLAGFLPGASSAFSHKLISITEETSDANKASSVMATAHVQLAKVVDGKYDLRLSGNLNRFSSKRMDGGDTGQPFIDPELSFSGRVYLAPWFGIEVTADKVVQYYHTLEGIPLGWSLDMIVPADRSLPAEKTGQLYAGILVGGVRHRFSAGCYSKKMNGLIFFNDASQLFSSAAAGWRNNIVTGTGTSKGLEVLYEAEIERFKARLAYTLSKTDRLFEGINNGEPFPAKFDRRHIFNLNVEYIFLKRERKELGINTLFTYQSGHWATVRSGRYSGWIVPGDTEVMIEYNTGIHNWQTPAYIRWDAGLFLRHGTDTSHPGTLNLGVYNILNRHNTYSIIFDPESRRWKKLSIFPIMPTVSYTLDF